MQPNSLATVAVDGGQIVCRAIGKGPPLVVLNGFGAASTDWNPSFIDRVARVRMPVARKRISAF